MKSSEILREAARRVESGKAMGGCYALLCVRCNYKDKKGARNYFKMVKPSRPIDGYWWPLDVRHGPRIIGLCLAAAIAESDGD